MPNISVQLRRGTTTEHNTFTGAEGEVTVDTDLDTLRVHDGSTAGGVRLAKHSELAGAAGNTDLSNTPAASSVEIKSSTGTNTTVAGASTSLAGVMTSADKTKLNGIATGATANSSDATLLNRANHTGTQVASTISNFDTEVANNTAVAANTAKVSNATHTGDVTGSTALTIANNAVTAAKISSSDTTLNVNDSNNNIGTGALADSGYQLTVDCGTGKDPIYAKGNKASSYVDVDIENENASGNGARLYLTQDGNSAVFQYQESGENASMVVVDGTLGANAGIKIDCDSTSLGRVFASGSMAVGNNTNIDLGTATAQWGTIYATALNINGTTSFASKYASSWFNDTTGLVNGGTYTFTHGLGTADVTFGLYVSSSSSGTNPQSLLNSNSSGTSNMYGGVVTDITSTEIRVQLGNSGYLDTSSSGTITTTTFVGKYIKIVVIG